jgi:hypothetical protein
MRAEEPQQNIRVLTPVLPEGSSAADSIAMQRSLLDNALASVQYDNLILWYYTPMALAFSDHVEADVCVYDCMDELSGFRGAPRELVQMERLLMQRADVVFTGGQSIYEAKRRLHNSIHPFPSSIDVAHFHKARKPGNDPAARRIFRIRASASRASSTSGWTQRFWSRLQHACRTCSSS